MKKIFLIAVCSFFLSNLFAQDIKDDAVKKKLNPSQINLSNRSNDHLLIQLGYTGWAGIPDTIATKGISRTFNAYFMFDMPFKTNKRMSTAGGVGVSTENIFFDKTSIGINSTGNSLNFKNVADTNHFKKYKMATTWLEVPLELRFSSDPLNNKTSFKAALGVKVGTLVNAHTKGKTLVNKQETTINAYSEKINSKVFFNTTRVQMTGRIGRGNLSLFGSYQVGSLFKEAKGPAVKPFSIGITVSGL